MQKFINNVKVPVLEQLPSINTVDVEREIQDTMKHSEIGQFFFEESGISNC